MDTTDENGLSVETDNEVDYFRDMSSDNSSFTVSEVDFLLGGGETTVVSLFWRWTLIEMILSWLKICKLSCIVDIKELMHLHLNLDY